MGVECLILSAIFAASVLAAPLDGLDVQRCQEQVYYRHKVSHFTGTRDEEKKHIYDTAKACEAIGGDYSRELFLLYGAVASVESEWKFEFHDSGIGWGPVACQDYEVFAAADRLGVSVEVEIKRGPDKKSTYTQQQSACWVRFLRDPCFCAWVSVRHIYGLIERHQGMVMPGVKRHNPKARHYTGDVLERYGILWGEMPELSWKLR